MKLHSQKTQQQCGMIACNTCYKKLYDERNRKQRGNRRIHLNLEATKRKKNTVKSNGNEEDA